MRLYKTAHAWVTLRKCSYHICVHTPVSNKGLGHPHNWTFELLTITSFSSILAPLFPVTCTSRVTSICQVACQHSGTTHCQMSCTAPEREAREPALGQSLPYLLTSTTQRSTQSHPWSWSNKTHKNLSTTFCNWTLDFLKIRPQWVQTGSNTSSIVLNTGAPHGLCP